MHRINDIVVGSAYQINRRITGVPATAYVDEVTLIVKASEATLDADALITLVIDVIESTQGRIIDNGSTSGVAAFHLDLASTDTDNLEIKKEYYYRIDINSTYNGIYALEEGIIYTKEEPTDDILDNSGSNSVPASYGSRIQNLVDGKLDAVLKGFRSLRVWDEHARRSSSDSKNLLLTYKNWNNNFQPMVVDGNNNPVQMSVVQIDYDAGSLVVTTDDGNQDYFVTYEFNLFPYPDLISSLEVALQEILIRLHPSVSRSGTLQTCPLEWDSILVNRVASKAFLRLSLDSSLWVNALIWKESTNAQDRAAILADHYGNLAETQLKTLELRRGSFIVRTKMY